MVLLLVLVFCTIILAVLVWRISERNKAIQDEMAAYHNTLVNTEELCLKIISSQPDDDNTWFSVN
jgi:hypothetical protein